MKIMSHIQNIRLKKISFDWLFGNKRLLMLFSLLIAITIWALVIVLVYPNQTVTIRDVPVNVDVTNTDVGKMGLSAIRISSPQVNVVVDGKRSVIGGLGAADIHIAASLDGVTGPGTYDLQLFAQNPSGDYELISINPSQVSVKFDKVISKTLKVETEVSGISIPDGFLKGNEIANPHDVVVTGPETDVNLVTRAVVRLNKKLTISSTETFKENIILLDENSNVVTSPDLKMDKSTAEVTIQVLKVRELPITINYTNIPQGFPVDSLSYTISTPSIKVAGPTYSVDNYTSIPAGYVDFRTIDLGKTINFDIQMPTGFVNIDNLQSVTVTFDTAGMIKKTFYVRTINVINAPAGYTFTVTTKSLGVTIIGTKSIVDSLTAGDIVAEIDAGERDVTVGQSKLPVNVYVPNKGLVWAIGTAEAYVNVQAS